MTKDRVIGKPGALPWRIPEDLKRFKNLTTGKTVIMGLNTYRTINRPLPKRNNIILSYEPMEIEGADVCTSIEEARAKAESYGKDIFVMGGAQVYEQMLPLVEKLHVSWVKKDYEGEIKFPEFKLEDWQETEREEFSEFTAVTYDRLKQTENVNA